MRGPLRYWTTKPPVHDDLRPSDIGGILAHQQQGCPCDVIRHAHSRQRDFSNQLGMLAWGAFDDRLVYIQHDNAGENDIAPIPSGAPWTAMIRLICIMSAWSLHKPR